MKIVPLELRELNDLVARLHRHHKPVQGHRFSLGVVNDSGVVVGGASVGRPVARLTNAKEVVEVTRLVTDGTPCACSVLYAAAARVAKEMGYKRIQTFILDTEPGTSLRASGWTMVGTTRGDCWTGREGRSRRSDQPTCPKQRWERALS